MSELNKAATKRGAIIGGVLFALMEAIRAFLEFGGLSFTYVAG